MEKLCNTCALYIPEQSGCARTQMIELPDHTCSHWCHEVPTCSVCGRRFVPPITYVVVEDAYIAMCPACFQARNTCGMCKTSTKCDFQENPIAIPPMIMKTIRHGNQTLNTQIRNPDRIAATCIASGCKCYHKDNDDEYCCRQFGRCSNYEMKDFRLKGE